MRARVGSSFRWYQNDSPSWCDGFGARSSPKNCDFVDCDLINCDFVDYEL